MPSLHYCLMLESLRPQLPLMQQDLPQHHRYHWVGVIVDAKWLHAAIVADPWVLKIGLHRCLPVLALLCHVDPCPQHDALFRILFPSAAVGAADHRCGDHHQHQQDG